MVTTYKDLKLWRKPSLSSGTLQFFFEEVLIVSDAKSLVVLYKNLVLILSNYVKY